MSTHSFQHTIAVPGVLSAILAIEAEGLPTKSKDRGAHSRAVFSVLPDDVREQLSELQDHQLVGWATMCIVARDFWACGTQAFALSPSLTRALARTEVRSDICAQMPYDCFWLSVDEHTGAEIAREFDDDTPPIDELYVWDGALWVPPFLGQDGNLDRPHVIILPGQCATAWRLVNNVAMYLSSPDAVIKAPPTRRSAMSIADALDIAPDRLESLARWVAKKSRPTLTTLGGASEAGGDCDTTTGDTAARRGHWVRGHWRQQWCGTADNRHQSPRWIRPHRRGTGEPIGLRVYKEAASLTGDPSPLA